MGDESRRTVVVLGASGFLGANIALTAASENRVIAHSSRVPVRHPGVEVAVFEASETSRMRELLDETEPDIVVNCVALASLESCESDPAAANFLNRDFPRTVAEACATVGARLVHVSTDAVFGRGCPPFTITDIPQPASTYGRTKLDGEREVLSVRGPSLVMRTNVVGWSPSRSRSLLEHFVDTLSRGEEVMGFDDVYFRPVSAQTFWRITDHWISDETSFSDGRIIHATGSERLSKYAFARRVAAVFELDQTLIRRSSISESPLSAPRTLDLDVIPTTGEGAETGLDADLLELRALMDCGWREKLDLFAPVRAGGTS